MSVFKSLLSGSSSLFWWEFSELLPGDRCRRRVYTWLTVFLNKGGRKAERPTVKNTDIQPRTSAFSQLHRQLTCKPLEHASQPICAGHWWLISQSGSTNSGPTVHDGTHDPPLHMTHSRRSNIQTSLYTIQQEETTEQAPECRGNFKFL